LAEASSPILSTYPIGFRGGFFFKRPNPIMKEMKRLLISLALCGCLISTSLGAETEINHLHTAQDDKNSNEQNMEFLVLEASTFFEQNPKVRRVSESKALSDLLSVANDPNLLDIVHAAKSLLAAKGRGANSFGLLCAIERVERLTFWFPYSEPERIMLYPMVIVDGHIHLNRWTGSLKAHGDFRIKIDQLDGMMSRGLRRSDLRPYLGQIMNADEYKADVRFHGEEDPVPNVPPLAPRAVALLENCLEDAAKSYKGPSDDNPRMVSDLLQVALVQNSSAIRDAVRIFINRHGREDLAAAVIDPLQQLLWGQSKSDKGKTFDFHAFDPTDGTLRLSDKLIYFGMDNDEWLSQFDLNRTAWRRRNLDAFRKQAVTPSD